MDNYLKAALSVEQLKVSYVQNKKRLPVLDGISFVLEKGKILALLGESGSGKSTCGKSLIGVLPPSAKLIVVLSVSGTVIMWIFLTMISIGKQYVECVLG